MNQKYVFRLSIESMLRFFGALLAEINPKNRIAQMDITSMEGGETIAERMEFVVKAAGGMKSAAAQIKVTEPALRSIVKGERNPGWKIISSLSEMGVDLNWFVTGKAMTLGMGNASQSMVKRLTDRLMDSERARIEQEGLIAQLQESLMLANSYMEKGRAYDAIVNSKAKD